MRANRWLMGLAIGLLAGCQTVAHPWAPVLDKPARPVLEYVSMEELAPLTDTAKFKVTNNAQALMLYARKLETVIDAYNEWRVAK